MKLKL